MVAIAVIDRCFCFGQSGQRSKWRMPNLERPSQPQCAYAVRKLQYFDPAPVAANKGRPAFIEPGLFIPRIAGYSRDSREPSNSAICVV